MIFKILAILTGGSNQPAQPTECATIGLDDPITRLFQGDLDALSSPEHIAERKRRRAKERAELKRRVEAIRFFTRGFNTLADAHVKAMAEINERPSPQKRSELSKFIHEGQQTLLTQADLLYGPSVVDDALHECGYSAHEFRRKPTGEY